MVLAISHLVNPLSTHVVPVCAEDDCPVLLPWIPFLFWDVSFHLPTMDIVISFLEKRAILNFPFPIAFADKNEYKKTREEPAQVTESSSSFKRTTSSTIPHKTSIMKLVKKNFDCFKILSLSIRQNDEREIICFVIYFSLCELLLQFFIVDCRCSLCCGFR